MRIAKLNMDPQDKLKFEIQGKSSVRYHLKANHQVEAKRWYWALNNAIQWTKDEDKEEKRRADKETEALKKAITGQDGKSTREGDSISLQSGRARSLAVPQQSNVALSTADDDEPDQSMFESSMAGPATRMTSRTGLDTFDDDEDGGDDESSHEAQPAQKDALNITAQSLRLQLDLLAQVSMSLAAERKKNPSLSFADPTATQAISAYESAVGNLKGLIGDFLRIANDRDAYWQYRLDREANIRRLWEENMAKVAKDQEELEAKMGAVEDKRKRTKRALKDALENLTAAENGSRPLTPAVEVPPAVPVSTGKQPASAEEKDMGQLLSPARRKSTFVDLGDISDSDSEDDEEFFDAVGAGEVEIVEMAQAVEHEASVPKAVENLREKKRIEIEKSFIGYEDPPRTRLKLDEDNRPKVGLWVRFCSLNGRLCIANPDRASSSQ